LQPKAADTVVEKSTVEQEVLEAVVAVVLGNLAQEQVAQLHNLVLFL
jgi:hypothetical protein